MRWTTACAVALLLATAACGGSDDAKIDEDDQTAATAISEFFSVQGMDQKQADCIGNALVEQFGIPHLKDIKVLDAKLEAQPDQTREFKAFSSTSDSTDAAEIVVECVSVAGVMKDQYQGIDDATADCLAEAFGRDRMVESMAAGLRGEAAPDLPADVTTEMSKCAPKN